ncbi:hypothetical protein [Candidatus Uabimicrobium sp. HlEnr_7]|uniref:hypothetical protein n=1 Tax=Candidatus Uabimicrobium helgolandensis TaxID=3095367 RepID=UPI003555C204
MWKTTHWSQILKAQNENNEALEKLCHDYWKPVYKSVQKYHKLDAEDLTQEFFTLFLENKWIERASKTKGKFRSFILVALTRFIRDKTQKKQNAFENEINYNYEHLEEHMANGFNRYWTEKLLDIVDSRMHLEYEFKTDSDYFIFKSYSQYSHRVLFEPSSLVRINALLNELQKEDESINKLNIDNLTKKQKYEIASTKLNQMITDRYFTYDVPEENYGFYSIDLKNQDWNFLKKQIETSFSHLIKNGEVMPNKKSIRQCLNKLIFGDLIEKFPRELKKPSAYNNRIFLEEVFSDYVEKYAPRHNREYFSRKYKSFCMPIFKEKPCYLTLAKYFFTTKYQIEQILKNTIDVYKQIIRDEVARYVCPENVSEEITYLQNLI